MMQGVTLHDLVGYTGVAFVLLAFYLTQAGHHNLLSYRNSLLNLIGSWLLLYSLYFTPNLPSVVIELAWTTISTFGIYRVYQRRKAAETEALETSASL